MVEIETDGDPHSTDGWAVRTAGTLRLARVASTVLLVGAGSSLLFAVVSSVISYSEFFGGFGELGRLSESRLALSQALQVLLAGLLPAGVLLAAGVAIRLQAARFETEFLDG